MNSGTSFSENFLAKKIRYYAHYVYCCSAYHDPAALRATPFLLYPYNFRCSARHGMGKLQTFLRNFRRHHCITTASTLAYLHYECTLHPFDHTLIIDMPPFDKLTIDITSIAEKFTDNIQTIFIAPHVICSASLPAACVIALHIYCDCGSYGYGNVRGSKCGHFAIRVWVRRRLRTWIWIRTVTGHFPQSYATTDRRALTPYRTPHRTGHFLLWCATTDHRTYV